MCRKTLRLLAITLTLSLASVLVWAITALAQTSEPDVGVTCGPILGPSMCFVDLPADMTPEQFQSLYGGICNGGSCIVMPGDPGFQHWRDRYESNLKPIIQEEPQNLPYPPGDVRDPGPPPPLNPEDARPNPRWPKPVDPGTGQEFPLLCDANWCYYVLPEGMTPGEFENYILFPSNGGGAPGGAGFPVGVGCWNSDGNVCIVTAASPEADQWLRDWAHWMYYQYGNNLCVLLSMDCAIPGWDVYIEFIPTNPNGNPGGDNPSPAPHPTVTPRPTPTHQPAPRPTPTPPTQPSGSGQSTPPPPSDAGCPAATWQQARPTFSVESAPAFPIVVGQDPDEVGVVYTVTVTVPPVVYRRWRAEYECRPVPDTDGDGIPDREGNCTTQAGDPPVEGPGEWTLKACHPQVILLPDPVAGTGRLEMTLRASSRRWIETELAQKYPGARVRMPEIQMPVAGRGWLRSDKAYVFRAVVNPKPVDPGIYDVTIRFRTQGTGVTPPLTLQKQLEQKVYLLETTIVR